MIDRFSKPRYARDAEHKVIYRNDAEFAGWPHISGFWEASKGELIQNFMRVKANYGDAGKISHDNLATGGSGQLQLCSIRSADRGRTWSSPVVIPGPANVAVADGVPDPITELGRIDFLDKDTLVWSSSTAFGSPESRAFVRISKDAGRTWSRSFKLPLANLQSLSAQSSQMVRPDGRSLLFLTMVSKDGWQRRPVVYGSTADNSTWHFMSFITPRDDPFGNVDGEWKTTYRFGGHRWFYPRGYWLPGGKLLCVLRSQRDPTGIMWTEVYQSLDGGRTWGFLSRVNDFGAPGSLVRMSDGRLVMVYGHRLPGCGVRARVSEDEAKTWGSEIILRDDGGSWDLGYPNAWEVAPGKIGAIYYFNRKDDPIQANGGVRHVAQTIFTVD
jgi:hypothetical protein